MILIPSRIWRFNITDNTNSNISHKAYKSKRNIHELELPEAIGIEEKQ